MKGYIQKGNKGHKVVTKRRLSFRRWLHKAYYGVDTCFGDLAGDVEADRNFNPKTREELLNHVSIRSTRVEEVARMAWCSYAKYCKQFEKVVTK